MCSAAAVVAARVAPAPKRHGGEKGNDSANSRDDVYELWLQISVFFDLCKNLSTFMIFYCKYIITDRSSIKP